jgi:hypothetical protein
MLRHFSILAFFIFCMMSFSFANAASKLHASYDLGIASGSVGNNNYTEGELGLNLFFNEFIDWRNSIFARFGNGDQNYGGLDTSVRGVYNDRDENFGYTAYAGPGYRFPTRGFSVPFAEGGLVLHIHSLSVGAGLRIFFNQFHDSSQNNDSQFLIILGAGGPL